MARKGISRRHGIGVAARKAPAESAGAAQAPEAATPGTEGRSATTPDAAPPAPPAAAASDIPPQQPVRLDRLARGRNLNDMQEPELRQYARLLGLTPRDAETLSRDRLIQNCRIKLVQIIDEL